MKAYDIDGVIANFVERFYEYFDKPYLEYPDWDDPFIAANQGILEDDDRFWRNLPLYNEMIPKNGLYVTNRPKATTIPTLHWFINHDISFSAVVITKDKVAVCKKYEVTEFIDDNPKNVKALLEAGIDAVLLDRVWNRNVDLPRVNSLKEFIDGSDAVQRWKVRMESNKLEGSGTDGESSDVWSEKVRTVKLETRIKYHTNPRQSTPSFDRVLRGKKPRR